MKYKFLTVVIIVILGFTLNSCDKEKTSQIQMVSPEEMKEIIKAENTQLVDVRTLNEFTAGHISGAQNIVYDENFANKITQLDKNQPVAVYCHSGGRSKKCAEILKEAGFKKIYDLDGGIEAWTYKDNLE